MIMKNYEIGELRLFLFNLILKNKETRMRTRFVELLDEQLKLIEKDRQLLINDYAKKDENGDIVTEKVPFNDEDREIIVFKDDEAESEVKKQIVIMMNEDFIIEETESKIEMLKILQNIVLNCDLEFTGERASLYNRFCEIFEEIDLLED